MPETRFRRGQGRQLGLPIRFRRDDKHLLEVETAFNEMMVARNEGVGVGIEVEVAQDRRAVS